MADGPKLVRHLLAVNQGVVCDSVSEAHARRRGGEWKLPVVESLDGSGLPRIGPDHPPS